MSIFLSRLSRWLHSLMPTHAQLEANRFTAPFARRQELFRFTRRSVPRGVAVGLLVGILAMIPGVQIAGAALICVPLRANIPLAAAMTFLSNPATTPLLLAASIWIGNRLGYHADLSTFYALCQSGAGMSDWLRWVLSDAGPALLAGLFLIAIPAAVIGYVAAVWFWRFWIGRKHHARRHRWRDALRDAGPDAPA